MAQPFHWSRWRLDGRESCLQKIAAIDQSLADMNGIATLAEIDLKSLHGAPTIKGLG